MLFQGLKNCDFLFDCIISIFISNSYIKEREKNNLSPFIIFNAAWFFGFYVSSTLTT